MGNIVMDAAVPWSPSVAAKLRRGPVAFTR
jgi:hypothetical protein